MNMSHPPVKVTAKCCAVCVARRDAFAPVTRDDISDRPKTNAERERERRHNLTKALRGDGGEFRRFPVSHSVSGGCAVVEVVLQLFSGAHLTTSRKSKQCVVIRYTMTVGPVK